MSEKYPKTLFKRTGFETPQDGQINILGSRLSAVLDMYGVCPGEYGMGDVEIKPTLEVADGSRVILIGASKSILYDEKTGRESAYRVELTATEAGVTIPIFTFDGGDTAVLYGTSVAPQQLDIEQMRELNDLVSELAAQCKRDDEAAVSAALATRQAELAEMKKQAAATAEEKAKKKHERKVLFARLRNKVGATLGVVALFAGAFVGVRKIADYDPDQAFDDMGYTLAGGAVAGADMTVEPEFSHQLIGSQELSSANIPQDDVIVAEDGLRQIIFYDAGQSSPRRCHTTRIGGDVPPGAVVRAWTDNRYQGQPRANELNLRFQPGTKEIIACWTGEVPERDTSGYVRYPRLVFQYVPRPTDTTASASQ